MYLYNTHKHECKIKFQFFSSVIRQAVLYVNSRSICVLLQYQCRVSQYSLMPKMMLSAFLRPIVHHTILRQSVRSLPRSRYLYIQIDHLPSNTNETRTKIIKSVSRKSKNNDRLLPTLSTTFQKALLHAHHLPQLP